MDMNRSPFVLLADPDDYIACHWDLTVDEPYRVHWVEFFKRNLQMTLALGVAAREKRGEKPADLDAAATECRAEFFARFDAFVREPADHHRRHGIITILTLDRWRDEILRHHGFIDAFVDLKQRENEAALPLLPAVCADIDARSGLDQLQAIIEGVFAGNIFDMGAEATARAFVERGPDFFATRSTLKPRPWLIDDFDELADAWLRHSFGKLVCFIDNAGSDFLLGAIPLMRWFAMRGTHVVLAANERPTLNDMTVHDVRDWWPRILDIEPSIRDLPIEIVSTGTGEPLIDLAQVSDELNSAAAGADLVILEGMGRGVESNLDASFKCPALNIAMLKDAAVATRCGGKLYDLVCRYR
jgi:type II pantothenate kinase